MGLGQVGLKRNAMGIQGVRKWSFMRYVGVIILFLSFARLSADPFLTERTVIRLSENWLEKMMIVSDYEGLKSFCNNDVQRELLFDLLEEIHYYHDVLEADLQSTANKHSRRSIRRIRKHLDKLETNYRLDDFEAFFREQCTLQSKFERNSAHYSAGFGTHSYEGKVYAQEVEMYRYIKRLSKSIHHIKKRVEDIHLRRIAGEI